MKHISLFSGIGGFDLAAQWAGWQNIASCEINPFGRRVLAHYWPKAYHHDDIHTFTKSILDEKLGQNWNTGDVVLSGGFPCQPYSAAGKRLGKEDDRHLWPEMLRAIREIQPRWVVGENVRGLVNWSGGLVFDEVQADLEAEGYEVSPFLLPAAGVGAPHRRDRIWFVAYRDNRNGKKIRFQTRREVDLDRHERAGTTPNPNNPRTDNAMRSDGDGQEGKRAGQQEHQSGPACGDAADAQDIRYKRFKDNRGKQQWERIESEQGGNDEVRCKLSGCCETAADADSDIRRKGWVYTPRQEEAERYAGTRDALCYRSRAWENFPTQSPVCGGDDGFSSELDGDAIQDLLQGATPREPWIPFGKWRNESIKAYGNAIVPQVVYQIFLAINEIETQSHCLPCGEITCYGQECPFR